MIWLCGGDTVNINPPKSIAVDLDKAYKALSGNFNILAKSAFAVTISLSKGIEVTIFRNGRMLLRRVQDEQTAIEVYDNTFQHIAES